MKEYIDYLYKTSPLNYFMNVVSLNQSHFAYVPIVKESNPPTLMMYDSVEHYVVEAKMKMRDLKRISDLHDINVNDAFIETLMIEAKKELDKQFINYIDNKCELVNVSENNLNRLRLFDFFFKNFRISLKSKKRRQIEKKDYFIGLLGDIYNNTITWRSTIDGNGYTYIIISADLANFVISAVEEFVKQSNVENSSIEFTPNNEKFDKNLMHVIGSIHTRIGNVVTIVNTYLPSNTMYFGLKKEHGLSVFYYIGPNAIVEYETVPDSPINIEKIYKMNLFHKFIDIDYENQSSFKKIIFNDE